MMMNAESKNNGSARRGVYVERSSGPAGRTTHHGIKRSLLFPAAGLMQAGSPDVAWDVFKKIRPAFVSMIPAPEPQRVAKESPQPNAQPVQVVAPALNTLQKYSVGELQKRAFESFFSGELEDARNCYLLLLMREPGQETYQRVLETIVEKIRTRNAGRAAATLCS